MIHRRGASPPRLVRPLSQSRGWHWRAEARGLWRSSEVAWRHAGRDV